MKDFDFLPDNLAFEWDGRHKGEAMNERVFTWFAEVEFVDGAAEVLKGGVSLMR